MEARGEFEHLAIASRLGQRGRAHMIVHVDVAVGFEPDRAVLAERGEFQHLAERPPQPFRLAQQCELFVQPIGFVDIVGQRVEVDATDMHRHFATFPPQEHRIGNGHQSHRSSPHC